MSDERAFTIRLVRPGDAAGVVGVLNAIIAAGEPVAFDAQMTVEAEAAYIAGFPARGTFFVAVADERVDDDRGALGGTIVGLQSVEPYAAHTHTFDHVGVIGTYVARAWRRRGVASRLFDATFAAAPGGGYEKLFTTIRADNAAGLAVYARHGFKVVGTARRHAKIAGRYVDEIVVERFLGSS